MNKQILNEYWKCFLKAKNMDEKLQYTDIIYFGSNEQMSNELLDLVLYGNKRATTSSIKTLEFEGVNPKIGDYYILTDFAKNPKGVVRTTNVLKMKFNEMTFEICKKEGEDDSLESWQKNHIKYFTEEGKQLGYTFSKDMEIVFEEFELL